jgi:hypothetical protein
MKMPVKLLTLSAVLLILVTGFVIYRKKFQYQSYCAQPVLNNLNQGKTFGIPQKVVVQPWSGRHNVYAIFMIPVEERARKHLVVTIPKAGTFCGETQKVGTEYDGIQAKPGYYLLKANLRTRTTSLLITKGFLNQLKDIRNWHIV